MHRRSGRTGVACAAAALCLAACGIPAEEYDARVKQLREAEGRITECRSQADTSGRGARTAQAGAARLAERVRQLETEIATTGLTTDAARAHYRAVLASDAEVQKRAAARAADRQALKGDLQEEITDGVISIEERDGALHMVIPAELLFSSGAASVEPAGRTVLDAVLRQMRRLTSRRFIVGAYLDHGVTSKAKEELALTLNRARQVTEYFLKQGVEPERLAAAGFGSAFPTTGTSDEADRPKNRVEITMVAAPSASASGSAPGRPASTKSATPGPNDDPGL